MSSFEERLSWLEGKVNTHDVLLCSTNNGIFLRTGIHATSSAHRAIDTQDPTFKEVVLQEDPQEETLTDGMAVTFVSEDDSGFFGV